MNIEHLSTFINLSETLNYSQTAIHMHISQSAVSQTISNMEKELGFQLFTRTRRIVSLTKGGQNFYKKIKPLLSTYNKAVQESQRLSESQSNDLTIGYSGTPYEIRMIPKIIFEFKKKYSNLNIYLENYDHSELKTNLESGECDVIFTMPDIVKNMENVKYIDLVEGYYAIHFSKFFIKKKEFKKIPLSALNSYRLIMLDNRWCPPSQDNLQKEIKRHNQHLNLAFANNISTSSAMTHANLGAGIWANFVSDPEDTSINNIALDYDAHPHYGIAQLKASNSTPATTFCSWVKKNFDCFQN